MKTVINDKTYMIFLIHSLNWFKTQFKMKTQLGITLQNLVDQMFHFLRGEGVKVPILGGNPHTHTITKQSYE